MSEDVDQSRLTKKVVDRINNIVILSVVLGMCISSFLGTFSHTHTGGGRLLFAGCGVGAFVFIILSLEYLGRFRFK